METIFFKTPKLEIVSYLMGIKIAFCYDPENDCIVFNAPKGEIKTIIRHLEARNPGCTKRVKYTISDDDI